MQQSGPDSGIEMTNRIKAALGVFVIGILLTITLAYIGMGWIRMSESKLLHDQASLISRQTETLLKPGFREGDLDLIGHLVRDVAVIPGVVFVRLRNDRGDVLVQTGDSVALSSSFQEQRGAGFFWKMVFFLPTVQSMLMAGLQDKSNLA